MLPPGCRCCWVSWMILPCNVFVIVIKNVIWNPAHAMRYMQLQNLKVYNAEIGSIGADDVPLLLLPICPSESRHCLQLSRTRPESCPFRSFREWGGTPQDRCGPAPPQASESETPAWAAFDWGVLRNDYCDGLDRKVEIREAVGSGDRRPSPIQKLR